MIKACFSAMIPFLVTMGLMTVTFAMVNISLDREENISESFGQNLQK